MSIGYITEDDIEDFRDYICANNFEKIKSMLEYDVYKEFFDCGHDHPIHKACVYCDKKVLDLLLKKGDDVNRLSYWNKQTPLIYACKEKILPGYSAHDENFIKRKLDNISFLIEKGADLNIVDKDKKTALHYAVENKNIEETEFLIKKGANLNIKDNEGKTPLFYAIYEESKKIVELLLKNKADLNIKHKDKKIVIDAIRVSTEKMQKVFVDNIININRKDKNKDSFLMNIINIKKNNNNSFLMDLSKKNKRKNIIKLILDKKLDLNIKNIDGETALSLACKYCDFEVISLIFNDTTLKKDENEIIDIIKKIISLDFSCEFEDGLSVFKLFFKKEYLNYLNKNGNSLLMLCDFLDIDEFLLKKGININIKNNEGKTVLCEAFDKENFDKVELISEYKKEINLTKYFIKYIKNQKKKQNCISDKSLRMDSLYFDMDNKINNIKRSFENLKNNMRNLSNNIY